MSRLGREGWSALCIIPQPTSWRAASACAPWISASEQVPKPSSSGQAPMRPSARPFTLPSTSAVSASASSVVCFMRPRWPSRSHVQRPRIARMPTCSTASATAATSKSVPASQKVVVPVRIISTQASSAAACSSSGVDRGVQRQQPVGQIARHRDVVEHQPAAQVLGEVDVRVHEAGRHHVAPAVDHPIGRPRRAHRAGRPHLHDVATVHQHRAVAQDPPLGVQREDRGVLDQDHCRSIRRRRSSARSFSVSKASRRSPE